MIDLNFMFMLLFVAILMALGIINFIQEKDSKINNMIGLLYIVGALGIVIYKIQTP